MSLETEIGRLADVLERIEAKMDGTNQVPPSPEPALVKKKTAKKGVKVEETAVAEAMTAEKFLQFCNTTLMAITDVAVRAKKIGEIKAMLQKNYNAASIKAVPAESIAECKVKFDTIIGA